MNLASIVLPLAFALPLAAQTNFCSSTLSAPGCGASLAIDFTPVGNAGNQTLTLTATGLQPNAHGLMVWGTMPINLPIGNGCSLLTDFLWGHTINVDGSGAWSWSRSWPASVTGQYYIQIGSFDLDASHNLVFAATECKLAFCQ